MTLKIPARISLQNRIKYLAAQLPDDAFLKGMLTSTALIQKAVEEGECKFFIVYGPLRYGKTAYAMKTLAQLHGTWDPKELSQYVVFTPIDFLLKIKRLRNRGKQLLLIWEDAGVWLNSMKWNDPLILAISRYLDVVGTDFAGVMFTTPMPSHVIKRVRGIPQCTTVKIHKLNDNASKPRLALGYRMWMLPDCKKSGVKPIFEDRYSALMPNVFFDWYQKERQSYANETFKEIETELYKHGSFVRQHEGGKQ